VQTEALGVEPERAFEVSGMKQHPAGGNFHTDTSPSLGSCRCYGTCFVGLGIVAGEVSHVARLLDRAEVKLREMLRRAKGVWGKSAPAVRVSVAVTISLCLVASVYGAYHVFSLASLVR
jgi:hypothetical protein